MGNSFFNMNKMYIESQMQSLSNKVPLGGLGTIAFGSTPEERLKGLMRKEKSELEAGSLDKKSNSEKEGAKKKKKKKKKGKAQAEGKKREGKETDSGEERQAGSGISGGASGSMTSDGAAASGGIAASGRNSGDAALYGRTPGGAAAYARTRGGKSSCAEVGDSLSPEALREAVVWSEILGEPVSRQRRKRRIANVGQGHTGPG